jgi:hypothetical protein
MKALVSLILIIGITSVHAQDRADSLISVLKKEIAQKDLYVKRKLQHIHELRMDLQRVNALSTQEQFHLYNNLYHVYKTFVFDSAFRFGEKMLEKAYDLNDKSKIGYARVKLSFIMISSGMFKETFDTLNVVEVNYLVDSTRTDYYRVLARAYSDLNIYNKDFHYRKYYNELNRKYNDSAFFSSKRGSFYDYYLRAVRSLHDKEYAQVINIFEALFEKKIATYPQLAVCYYDLGNAYRGLGQIDKTIESTAMSSICDIRAATKETAAMYTLARLLFEQGDIDNANIFIRQAVDDADFYGARQRKVEIGSILPVIANAALNNSESQGRLYLGFGIGLLILFLLVVIFAVIIFKQLKKLQAAEAKIMEANESLQEMNQKLTEANKIKEEYIGYYFSINSEYLDKIESFKRSVEQKLLTKKFDDIKFIVNNINAKRERDELYFSFDKVFLKLFPDFVNTFNSYFKPEDQFVLKEGQLLNTELRIFALIRMGITDAEDIARILNYSVNTIYAYKTRIRSKSVLPNEIFDEKVMEIKAM